MKRLRCSRCSRFPAAPPSGITLAQDQALERWQMCQGKAPDITLKEVRRRDPAAVVVVAEELATIARSASAHVVVVM